MKPEDVPPPMALRHLVSDALYARYSCAPETCVVTRMAEGFALFRCAKCGTVYTENLDAG